MIHFEGIGREVIQTLQFPRQHSSREVSCCSDEYTLQLAANPDTEQGILQRLL